MTKLRLLFLLPLSGLLLSGCAQVPATRIKLPTKIGLFQIDSPKETQWTNVVVDIKSDGTTHIAIGSVSSHNDSDVIAAVANSNAQMADRGLALAEKVVEAGAAGTKKGLLPGAP